jgi:hypothetical protein
MNTSEGNMDERQSKIVFLLFSISAVCQATVLVIKLMGY